MNEHNLETQLLNAGFPGLFLYGDRSLCDTIWEKGNNEEALKRLVVSGTASNHAKFLAAEMLRKYSLLVETAPAHVLAEIYADALKNSSDISGNNFNLSGNLWGLLYQKDDAGHLGTQLISFGRAAVPSLIKLLGEEGLVFYEGSKEATLGNEYRYRVKDFAAFYISKIKNIPVQFHIDVHERDKEIERLKISSS